MTGNYVDRRAKRKSIMFACLLALVIGGLMVMPAAAALHQLTDRSISDAVEDELLMDTAVPSQLINVVTANGIVTLSGSVDNILAKERAARIASIVKGVRSVVNKIIVDPSILRTDGQILDDVQEALLTDPATDSYEIQVAVDSNDVKVNGDKVILSGIVGSAAEKTRLTGMPL